MRVILLQDIEKVGKQYEVKEVKDGYAQNFLLPQSLVKPATPENLAWLEAEQSKKKTKEEEELKEIQSVATKIDGIELIVAVKVGDEGQLFESITDQKIIEKLTELGFKIKKNQINLEEPIKELGEFPVKIVFDHNLEAEITVIVTEDSKQ